jgi:hypothetical protein
MIDNLTPFGAAAAFAYDLDDEQVVTICVASSFDLPPAGSAHDRPLTPAAVQPPPPMADEHTGSPATTSLRVPGQGAPHRLATEIYLHGSAWAPQGRRVTEMRTRVTVGPCRKEVHLVGDRYWIPMSGGLGATAPEPFVTMPLSYERAFGGTAWAEDGRMVAQEARNPIGRGVHASVADATHRPLPNLESPGERVTTWSARASPAGYGPIPGSWQPRLRLAGTFDEAWAANRAPLWPEDTDPRFFSAGAPGLLADGPLDGSAQVALEGFSPDGPIVFRLPELRLVAKSYYGHGAERGTLELDAVLLDTDASTVTLFWRRVVPLGRGAGAHLHTVVGSWNVGSPMRHDARGLAGPDHGHGLLHAARADRAGGRGDDARRDLPGRGDVDARHRRRAPPRLRPRPDRAGPRPRPPAAPAGGPGARRLGD